MKPTTCDFSLAGESVGDDPQVADQKKIYKYKTHIH